MGIKNFETVSHLNMTIKELKSLRRELVSKGNTLLKRHEYLQAQLIKEDIVAVDHQLKAKGVLLTV